MRPSAKASAYEKTTGTESDGLKQKLLILPTGGKHGAIVLFFDVWRKNNVGPKQSDWLRRRDALANADVISTARDLTSARISPRTREPYMMLFAEAAIFKDGFSRAPRTPEKAKRIFAEEFFGF